MNFSAFENILYFNFLFSFVSSVQKRGEGGRERGGKGKGGWREEELGEEKRKWREERGGERWEEERGRGREKRGRGVYTWTGEEHCTDEYNT